MTRNRDDFSALQALRTGFIAVLAVVALMAALGAMMSEHKQSAERRATSIAANTLDFATVPATEVAAAETATKQG